MLIVVLTWVGMACWGVCFWWMHRISSRQEAMLKELHEMTKRVQEISEAGHQLIQDVHPQVGEIKEHVESVKEAVSPEKSGWVNGNFAARRFGALNRRRRNFR